MITVAAIAVPIRVLCGLGVGEGGCAAAAEMHAKPKRQTAKATVFILSTKTSFGAKPVKSFGSTLYHPNPETSERNNKTKKPFCTPFFGRIQLLLRLERQLRPHPL